MAGVSNIVELLFRVSDQASGPSRNIASSFEGLKGSAMAAAAATATIGAGVLAVAKQAVDLGSKFEDTSINIAGNIRAFQLAPTFDAATKAAAGALDTIEAMAAKLPGETDQYVEVFKVALPKAIESGMSDIKAITDLTSRFTAVAVSGGVEAGQAGMDMFRMLAGQAGADVRMFTMLAPHLKMTAVQFNKLTIEARRLAIDKTLGNFSEMMEAAGNTFSSKMGEAQSHLKALVRLAGQPIFTAVVEQLGKMNEYLAANKTSLLEMGKALSTSLIAGVKTLADHFDSIVTAVTQIGRIWIAFKAGVVASSIVNGIMAIVRAIQLLRSASIAAAAAEAFATGGASAAVGAVAMAGVYAMFGMAGGEAESAYAKNQAAAEKATKMADIAQMNKGVAELSQILSDVTLGKYTKFGDILPTEGPEALRAALKVVGKDYARLSEQGQSAFAVFAKQAGLSVADLTKESKYKLTGKATVPGGPKKADVIIENARFDIKQSFAEGYDPDRIAAAFVESIGSTALYPGQSGFAAAGTGA